MRRALRLFVFILRFQPPQFSPAVDEEIEIERQHRHPEDQPAGDAPIQSPKELRDHTGEKDDQQREHPGLDNVIDHIHLGSIVGENDILEQAKQIVRNIQTELKAVGAGPENVVMTTTYVLADHMDDFLMTGAASALFEGLDNPADSLIGVASLAGMKYGALLEVTAIAVIN